MIDFQPYLDLKASYESWEDSDINGAFRLSVDSNSLESYYGCQLAEYEKLKLELKKQAESVEAHVSLEADPKSPTNGNRKAKADQRTTDAYGEYCQAVEFTGKLEAIVRFLGNVHWQTKEVYQQMNRKYAKSSS